MQIPRIVPKTALRGRNHQKKLSSTMITSPGRTGVS